MFINDATYEELFAALKIHKELIKTKYGSGDGKEVSIILLSSDLSRSLMNS